MRAGGARGHARRWTRATSPGEARAPVTGALPTTFIGSPDTVVEQVRRCREVVGAGVLDLSLHPPGSTSVDAAHAGARAVRHEGPAAHPRHLSGRRPGVQRAATIEVDGRRLRYRGGRAGQRRWSTWRRRRARADAGPRAPVAPFRVVVFEVPGLRQTPETRRDARPARSRSPGLETFNLMATSSRRRTALGRARCRRRRGVTRPGARSALPIRPRGAPSGDPGGGSPTHHADPRPARHAGRRAPAAAVGRAYQGVDSRCHLVFVYGAGHAIAPIGRRRSPRSSSISLERREAFVISRATTLINP